MASQLPFVTALGTKNNVISCKVPSHRLRGYYLTSVSQLSLVSASKRYVCVNSSTFSDCLTQYPAKLPSPHDGSSALRLAVCSRRLQGTSSLEDFDITLTRTVLARLTWG